MAESKKLRLDVTAILAGFGGATAAAFLCPLFVALVVGTFQSLLEVDKFWSATLFILYFFFVYFPFVVCGIISASIAKEGKYVHASVAGGALLAILLLVAIFFLENSTQTRLADYLYYISVLPCSLLGAWLFVKYDARRSSQPSIGK